MVTQMSTLKLYVENVYGSNFATLKYLKKNTCFQKYTKIKHVRSFSVEN